MTGAGHDPSCGFSSAILPAILTLLVLSSTGCSSSESVVRSRVGASDTVSVRLERAVARFENARSMDLSPSMKLYVADASADRVRIFDISMRDGRMSVTPARPAEIGGSGTDPGRFIEPLSVDASSALFVTVADAGNGRIQRFTADGALVEVLPVPRGTAGGPDPDPRFRSEDSAVGAQSTGARPVAVESSPADDILVIEQESGDVLMTDSRRRSWLPLGAADSRPADPVDIEFSDARIFVADAAGNRLFVYDRLGTFLTSSHLAAVDRITGLIPTSAVPAILSGDVFVHNVAVGDEPTTAVRFLTGETVRDVRMAGGMLIVLTNRSLFVVPRPEGFP